MTLNTEGMHSWVNRAVELAHTAKESVKGHRREREKLQKLQDQYNRRKGGLLMFDKSTLERQRNLVQSLQVSSEHQMNVKV